MKKKRVGNNLSMMVNASSYSINLFLIIIVLLLLLLSMNSERKIAIHHFKFLFLHYHHRQYLMNSIHWKILNWLNWVIFFLSLTRNVHENENDYLMDRSISSLNSSFMCYDYLIFFNFFQSQTKEAIEEKIYIINQSHLHYSLILVSFNFAISTAE